MDAIPIQHLVDAAKKRTIDLVSGRITMALAAWLGPLSVVAGWGFRTVLEPVIKLGVKVVVDHLDTGLFKVNMDVVTSDQAADWRADEALLIKRKQDPTLSKEEWKKLEYASNHSFDQLWNLTK